MRPAPRRLWVAFCAGAALLVVTPARYTDPAKLALLSLFRPVDRVARALETLATWQLDSPPGAASVGSSAEVDSLRTALVRAESESARLRQILAGVTELRRAPLARQPRLIAANVLIGRDTSDWRNSFIIDRGRGDGIAVGCPVVFGSTLVGRVRAVGASTSEVQCVTDPEFEVACTIVPAPGGAGAPRPSDNADGARRAGEPTPESARPERGTGAARPESKGEPADGIACGREGQSLCGVRWVERHHAISPGDLVFASGTGEQTLFDGLLIGAVVRASTAETGFYYKIEVEPSARSDRLREVFVLQRPVQAAAVPPTRKAK